MPQPVPVTYYGDDASKPEEATAQWTELGRIQVVLRDRTEEWSVYGIGFAWELSAGALRVMHGDPRHSVIIRDSLAIRAWTAHFKAQKLKQGSEDRVPWILGIPMMLPLGFIALCIAAYLWLLPYVSERLAMALPPETDVRIGDAMFENMATTLAIDSPLSETLQAFADRLTISPSYKLKLHVVKDDQVNAFAMPGGHIVVYTGILDKMKEPGELAALLAHEGTHVEKRHSTRGLARDLSGSLFLSLVLGDIGDVVGIAAKKGDELRGLNYSRDLETEADTVGIRRMYASGVHPIGMVKLLRLLEREAQDMPEGMSFLSSHPLTKDRIATASNKAAELDAMTSVLPGLDSLFQILKQP
ncbi:MAG: M48 family metallopeptidase [Flavobacteriales bacterium]|nr:M48 family metallopeptidase [Flavobacteriales bacterium]